MRSALLSVLAIAACNGDTPLPIEPQCNPLVRITA